MPLDQIALQFPDNVAQSVAAEFDVIFIFV